TFDRVGSDRIPRSGRLPSTSPCAHRIRPVGGTPGSPHRYLCGLIVGETSIPVRSADRQSVSEETNVKMRPRAAAAIGVAVAMAVLSTGCSGSSSPAGASSAEPQRGGTLTYAFNTEAQSVDPATCAIGVGMHPCQAIYGALMY